MNNAGINEIVNGTVNRTVVSNRYDVPPSMLDLLVDSGEGEERREGSLSAAQTLYRLATEGPTLPDRANTTVGTGARMNARTIAALRAARLRQSAAVPTVSAGAGAAGPIVSLGVGAASAAANNRRDAAASALPAAAAPAPAAANNRRAAVNSVLPPAAAGAGAPRPNMPGLLAHPFMQPVEDEGIEELERAERNVVDSLLTRRNDPGYLLELEEERLAIARERDIRNFELRRERITGLLNLLVDTEVAPDESEGTFIPIPDSQLTEALRVLFESRRTTDLTKHMQILLMLLGAIANMKKAGKDVRHLLARLRFLSGFDMGAENDHPSNNLIRVIRGRVYVDASLLPLFNDDYFPKIVGRFLLPDFLRHIRNRDFFEQSIVALIFYRSGANRFLNMRSMATSIMSQMNGRRAELRRIAELTRGRTFTNNYNSNSNFARNYATDIGRFANNLDEVLETFEANPANVRPYEAYEKLSKWNKVLYLGLNLMQLSSNFINVYNTIESRRAELETISRLRAAADRHARETAARAFSEEEAERNAALAAAERERRGPDGEVGKRKAAFKEQRATRIAAENADRLAARARAEGRLAARREGESAAVAGAGAAIEHNRVVRAAVANVESARARIATPEPMTPERVAETIASAEAARDTNRGERCAPRGRFGFDRAATDPVCEGMATDIFHRPARNNMLAGDARARRILEETGAAVPAADAVLANAAAASGRATEALSAAIAGELPITGGLAGPIAGAEGGIAAALVVAEEAVRAHEAAARAANEARAVFHGRATVVGTVIEAIGPRQVEAVLSGDAPAMLAAHSAVTNEMADAAIVREGARVVGNALYAAAAAYSAQSARPDIPGVGRPRFDAGTEPEGVRVRAVAGHHTGDRAPYNPSLPDPLVRGFERGDVFRRGVSGGAARKTRRGEKKQRRISTRRQRGGDPVTAAFEKIKHASLNEYINILLESSEGFKKAILLELKSM